MNQKTALFMACCAISCLTSCNESVHWHTRCANGDKDCSAQGVLVCTDGKWVQQTECAPGTLCNPMTFLCEDASLVECQAEGARKCADNRVMICDGERWNIEKRCTDEETCNESTFACDPKTEPKSCDEEGARKCENNKVMQCSSGNWNFVEDCGTDMTCNDTTFVCDPNPRPDACDEENDRKCEDNKVMTCDGEAWNVEKTCAEDEICNTTFFTCVPSALKCDEKGTTRCSEDLSHREICTGGSWTKEGCDNASHCVMTDEGAICAECEGDETRCEVIGGISMLSKCVDHNWVDPQACVDIDPTKMVCDANPGKTCVDVLELLECPEEGNVACQDVYGTEYAVICENGVVTEASGVCEEGKVCYVPEGGCTTPDECGNDSVGAGEDCEEGKLGDATCATVTKDANATGDLACTACKYDITGCLYCGDGTVNNSEVCDGSVPEDATCTTVINDGKQYTGTLKCKDDCTYDLTECTEEIPEDCTPENCKTDDPNATAECVQNTCEIKCIDGYTDVEGVCKPKACTAEETKCGEDVFYKCSEGELKSIPMPDDGKHYICDATTDNGWVEVACTEDAHCTATPHATMACNANVCEVASCEGNWSVNADKDACECTGNNVLNGEECVVKCTAADTKCDGGQFYKCEDSGLVKTSTAPTDGKHYICDATTDNGWVQVACIDASHCTDVPAHATMACNANVCEVSACEGNWSVNADKDACECTGTNVIYGGECVDVSTITCTIGGSNYAVGITGCDNDKLMRCTDTGEPVFVEHCEFGCASGECKDPVGCGEIAHNATGCSDGEHYATCYNGEWINAQPCTTTDLHATPVCVDDGQCDLTCDDGFTKNGAACDRDILACQFQYIGYSTDFNIEQAYAHVAKNGRANSEYNGRLVCINQSDSSDIKRYDASYYLDEDDNYLFRVEDISAMPAGKYNCTFEFKLASASTWYACQGVNYNDTWKTPIIITGDDYSPIPENDWYREYTVQLCTPGSKICEGASQYKVCDSEGLSYGAAQDCPTDPNGAASCGGEGECTQICNTGYTLGSSNTCDPKSCTDYAGNTIANGGEGCQTTERRSTCHLGEWSTEEADYTDCPWGCDSSTNVCKDPVGCTDYNDTELAHGELGCKTATQKAECQNGSMIDATLCSVDKATGVKCTGKGDCEATACQDGYHVKDGKCEVNVCEPNKLLGCSGQYYTRCASDGSEELVSECEAKSHQTVTAICNADNSVACNYACVEGYEWNTGMTECVEIHCTDAVSGNTLNYGDLGCASSNAYGHCGNGGHFDSETIGYCDVIAHGSNLCQTGACVVTCDANHAYNTSTKKCDPTVSICAPDQWECTGDTCKKCNDDGTDYIQTYTCTAMENASVTAAWDAENSRVNCSYQCNAGYNPNTAMNACLPVTCSPNAVTCSDGIQSICNAYGTETTSNPCTAPDHASPSCNATECSFECDYGYDKNEAGTACVAVSCTPGSKKCDGTDVLTCNAGGNAYDRAPCPSVEHATTTCSGAGACDFTCDGGYAKGTNTCDREVLACNFQAYNSSTMTAYGRLNTNGKPVSDYEGRLVCMTKSGSTTTYYTINANQNTGANVSPNVEFMTTTSKFPEGNYQCSFEFKLKTSDTWFTCQGVEEGWATPIPIYGTDYSAVPETGWFRDVNINYENKKAGDTLVFGNYKGNPIEWYIMSKDTKNRRFMLVSVDILDYKPYHTASSGSIMWFDSSIRNWLNGYKSYASDSFISNAFTSEEQSRIPALSVNEDCVELRDSADYSASKPTFDVYHSSCGGGSSKDKVFLLSSSEAKSLGSGSNACTNMYSKIKGSKGMWWLRSYRTNDSGNTYRTNIVVLGSDYTNSLKYKCATYNSLVRISSAGVRPAIYLNY